MSDIVLLILGFVLIVGTGFFVAAEFSLLALDPPQVHKAVKEGDRRSRSVLFGLKSLSTQLSGAQLGITLTTLLTGYLLEPVIVKFVRDILFFVPHFAMKSVSIFISMFLVTFFSMLIGELIPKNAAITAPMAVAKVVVPFQISFTRIFYPIILLLNSFSNKVLHLWGLEAKEELQGGRTPEELSSLVKRSAELGTLDKSTADFVTKTLSFADHTAVDVMTPRTGLCMANLKDSASEVLLLAKRSGFSRFPVIGDSPDNILGIIHVKHAMAVPFPNRDTVKVESLMSKVFRIPETMSLDSLLKQLRSEILQFAVVIDEYGGTSGVVTLEDLVEEIVGDLADEHDKLPASFRKLHNGDYVFSGMLRPDEIHDFISDLFIPDDSSYETVAGFMMSCLGRIAVLGDYVVVAGGKLVVYRMEDKRISWVKFIADSGVTDG